MEDQPASLPVSLPVSFNDGAIADLDAAERGFVLALLLTGGGDPAQAAAALTEPVATRCREAVLAIGALPRPERLRWMGLLARAALDPLPAGIEDIQEDVLRAALAPESASVIRLVAAQGPPTLQQAAASVLRARGMPPGAPDALAVSPHPAPGAVAELQRAVMTGIVPVPPVTPGTAVNRLGRRLSTLRPAELLAEVTAAGADLLGASLRGADSATLDRAAGRIGPGWSDRIRAAARADPEGPVDPASRLRAHALMAAVAPAENPQRTLERLGARDLGDRLGREDPGLVMAVGQRLPPDLRRELLAAADAAAAI